MGLFQEMRILRKQTRNCKRELEFQDGKIVNGKDLVAKYGIEVFARAVSETRRK